MSKVFSSWRVGQSLTGLALSILSSTAMAQADIQPDLDRAYWMFEEGRFGAGTHFLGGARDINFNNVPAYRANPPTTANWNAIVNSVDVDELAQDLQDAGVGWFLITLGQTRGFVLSPSAIYDQNAPLCSSYASGAGQFHWREDVCAGWNPIANPNQRADFTPDRDLIEDLADALHERGIRMVVYAAYEIPSRWNGSGNATSTTEQWYVDYMEEMSLDWGEKVDAWWIDGFYPEAGFPTDETVEVNGVNLQDHSDALRAGNPDRAIVAYNRGGFGNSSHLVKTTNREEYTDGTLSNFVEPLNNLLPQAPDFRTMGGSSSITGKAQWHLFTPLEGFERWGDYLSPPRFDDSEIAGYMVTIAEAGGVATFDVGIEDDGNVTDAYKTQLTAINRALDGSPNNAPTIIDESDPGITYSPDWQWATVNGVNEHGGSLKETIGNTNYFEYTFNGTGIDVIMPLEAVSASEAPNTFEVFIDGSATPYSRTGINGNSITSYAAGNGVPMNQVPVVRIRGLVNGQHTIRVQKTGGSKLQLDALRIIGALNDDMLTAEERINDTDPNITYSGIWQTSDNRSQGDYNSDVHYSANVNAYTEYTFTGNGVRFITEVGPADGGPGFSESIEIEIDGAPYGSFTGSASTFSAQYPLFSTGLIEGEHTLRITKGDNNGRLLLVDAVDVLNKDNVVVNNDSAQINYSTNGNWFSQGNRPQGDYGGDITGTKVNGAYAELTFVGTGVTFYTEVGPGLSQAVEVMLDGVSQGVFDLSDFSQLHAQYAIFSVENLAPAEHTIRLVNESTASEWMLIDAIGYTKATDPSPDLPPFGTKITLQSLSNGKFLCVDQNDQYKLKASCSSGSVQNNGLFEIEDAGSGLIALKAEAGGNARRIRCILNSPSSPCDSNGGYGNWTFFEWDAITSETIRLLPTINTPNSLKVDTGTEVVDSTGDSAGLETQFRFEFIN